MHAAESYALEVEIEQRVGEVPEALRQLDAALVPYLEQRRDVVALLPVEVFGNEWPEEQKGEL